MRGILAGVLLFLLPGLAFGATCANGSSDFRWTAVGTTVPAGAWTCGNGAATDTYVLSGTGRVTIDGTVTLTTGTMEVPVGTLGETCGSNFNPGAHMTVDGGIFEPQGCILTTAVITKEPVWGTSTAQITLDVAPTGFSATTDFLVFGDEDPPPGQAVSGCVWAKAGRSPDASCFRPSYNEWSWYVTTGLSGNVLTYQYDPLAGSYNNVPYPGSRAAYSTLINGPGQTNPACTASGGLAATICSSMIRRHHGFSSFLEVNVTQPVGTGANVAIVTNDRGSMYVYFTENPTLLTGVPSGDASYCQGKSFKILDSKDGGAGNDFLEVLGDITPCYNGQFYLTPGARRGDLVRIVRAARITGNQGQNNGYILWNGGSINARWARFANLGTFQKGTSLFTRAANLAITFNSATVYPQTGYLVDSDFVGGEADSTPAESAGLLLTSASSSGLLLQPTAPNGGILDFSGITFRRLHIHDGKSDYGGSGHIASLIADGFTNLTLTQTRTERTGLEGLSLQENTWQATGGTPNSSLVQNSVEYEMMTGTHDASVQCFEQAVANTGTGANWQQQINLGPHVIRDVIAMGCEDTPIRLQGFGFVAQRLLQGGEYAASSSTVPVYIGPSSSAQPTILISMTNPNIVKDSILPTLSYRTVGSNAFTLQGKADGIITWGNELLNDAVYHVGFGWSYSRSFLDFGPTADAGNGNDMFVGGATVASLLVSELDFQDTVVLGQGNALCRYFDDAGFVFKNINITRLFLGLNAPVIGRYLEYCAVDNGSGNTMTTTINGLFATATTPAASTGNQTAGNGSNIQNTCMSVLDTRTNAFGASFTPTSEVFGKLYPTQDNADVALRSYLGDPLEPDNCSKALPDALGLQSVGPQQLMGGNGIIDRIDLFSDKNLIRAVSGGGSGGGPRNY